MLHRSLLVVMLLALYATTAIAAESLDKEVLYDSTYVVLDGTEFTLRLNGPYWDIPRSVSGAKYASALHSNKVHDVVTGRIAIWGHLGDPYILDKATLTAFRGLVGDQHMRSNMVYRTMSEWQVGHAWFRMTMTPKNGEWPLRFVWPQEARVGVVVRNKKAAPTTLWCDNLLLMAGGAEVAVGNDERRGALAFVGCDSVGVYPNGCVLDTRVLLQHVGSARLIVGGVSVAALKRSFTKDDVLGYVVAPALRSSTQTISRVGGQRD